MDDGDDLVVDGGRAAYLAAKVAHGAVDGIYFGLLAFLNVLQHAGLEELVLLDGERQQQQGDAFLDGIVVVEQLDDVLALYGFDMDVACCAHVDALLDDGLHHLALRHLRDRLAEGTAEDSAHAREGGIDEQLAPTVANEVVIDMDGAHHLEQGLDIGELGVRFLRDGTQREGEAVGFAGKLAHAGTCHRGSPGYRTAEDAVFTDNRTDQHLGQAVLKGDDDTVVGQIIFQEGHRIGIVLLSGHQEDDVVDAGHLVDGQCMDGLGEVHGAGDGSAVRLQRLDVGLVAIDKVYLSSIFRDECAEDGS